MAVLAESLGYVLTREDNGELTISSPDGLAPALRIEEVDGNTVAVIDVESMTFTDNERAEEFTQLFNRAVNSMYVFNNVLSREQNR